MKLTLFKSQNEVRARVQEMAAELRKRLRNETKDIVVIGILNGAAYFFCDLTRELLPCYTDFWGLSSYGDEQKSSGHLVETLPVTVPVEDRIVILVDDIADTGYTLSNATRDLRSKNPASIITVALLKRDTCETPVDFVGFEVADGFFVGYGLDDQQKMRNLPGLFTL